MGRGSVACGIGACTAIAALMSFGTTADGDSASWTTLRASPLARTEVTSAAIGRSIYVLGGYGSAGAPSTAVTRYDVDRDRWNLAAPLPRPLNHAMAVPWRGDLYVVGGYTGLPLSLGIGTGGVADATRDFWRYEPERDRWSRMPPAPTARAAAAAGVLDGKLYVAAGADALAPRRRLEVFDFASGRWSRGPDLPLATEHTAGAVVGGAFYVVGGRPHYGGKNHRFVQRYQPRERRWQRVADLRRGRGGFAAAAVCGRVAVFGGEDPRSGLPGTIPEVELYDPGDDRWMPLPAMGKPRHGLGGASVGRRIYALEGGDVTLLSVTNVGEALTVPCPNGAAEDEQRPASAGRPVERGGPDDPGDTSRPASRPSSSARSEAAAEEAGTEAAPTGSDGSLPATGLVVALLCGIGAALTAGGLLLRRRTRYDQSTGA